MSAAARAAAAAPRVGVARVRALTAPLFDAREAGADGRCGPYCYAPGLAEALAAEVARLVIARDRDRYFDASLRRRLRHPEDDRSRERDVVPSSREREQRCTPVNGSARKKTRRRRYPIVPGNVTTHAPSWTEATGPPMDIYF